MVQPSLLGSDLRINGTAAGDQSGSGSISLSNGNALVYWSAGGTEYARIITAADKAGSDLSLDVSGPVTVDSLSTGGFEVGTFTAHSVYGTTYDATGLFLMGNSQEDDTHTVTGFHLATADNEVVYAIQAVGASVAGIVDTSGNVIQDQDDLLLNNGSGISARDSAGNPWNVLGGAAVGTGELAVATLTGSAISLHVVNLSNFSDISGPIMIASGPNVVSSTFKFSKLANGNVVASWRDGTTLYAQQYDASGHAVGSRMQATGTAPGNVDVAGLSDGSFLMTWSDLLLGSQQVMAEAFTSAGVANGAAFRVNDSTSGNHTNPSIVQLGGGDVLITYDYANGSTIDVGGRLLSYSKPDAVSDYVTTVSGQTITVPALANDTSPNGATLSITTVVPPAFGTATTDGTNIFYTAPADYVGPDALYYTVTDSNGKTDTATVEIQVNSIATTWTDAQALAYIASYPDLIGALGANPEAGRQHYENGGQAEGRTISFDALEYVASNPDLISAFGTNVVAAETHYIDYGFNEGRSTSSFDALEYIASNPDLIRAFGTNTAAAEQHYIADGFAEGRATSSFDALEYTASNSDLISAFGTNTQAAESHYITNGFAEGRSTDSFDALEYIASNPDLISAFGLNTEAAESHYITNGFAEGRSTSSFDALEYVASNPDLIAAFGTNATEAESHYVAYGFNEHRSINFDPVAYLLSQPDLDSAGIGVSGALNHWIDYGYVEGRSGDATFGREQTSHDLAIGQATVAAIDNTGDHDWYAVNASVGDRIDVNLTLSGSGGVAALSVHDAAGHDLTPLATSFSSSGQSEDLTFSAPVSNSYYIVASASPAYSGGYSISAGLA